MLGHHLCTRHCGNMDKYPGSMMGRVLHTQVDLLRARFLSAKSDGTRRRRRDYRGERVRLNLRVSAELGEALDLLKQMAGTDKNGFCEQALAVAVRAELARLQASRSELR